MDISTMSTSDLRRLQARIAKEVDKRTNVERRVLVRQFKKMAAERGLTLEQLLGNKSGLAGKAEKVTRKGRQPRGTAVKKPRAKQIYFNPANPEQGWSGHGRRPQWVLDWQAQGKSIEQLRRDGSTPKPPQTPPSQAYSSGIGTSTTRSF